MIKLIILFKSTKLFVWFVIILSGQTGRGKHQRGKTQKSILFYCYVEREDQIFDENSHVTVIYTNKNSINKDLVNQTKTNI